MTATTVTTGIWQRKPVEVLERYTDNGRPAWVVRTSDGKSHRTHTNPEGTTMSENTTPTGPSEADVKAATDALKAELESPEMQAAVSEVIDGPAEPAKKATKKAPAAKKATTAKKAAPAKAAVEVVDGKATFPVAPSVPEALRERVGAPVKGHKGYFVRYPYATYSLATRLDGKSPKWLAVCQHGNVSEGTDKLMGEGGVEKQAAARKTWCDQCATPAAKAAPAKKAPAAKKAEPAKKATTTRKPRSKAARGAHLNAVK